MISESDYSDLTEIEDDDYKGPSKKKKKGVKSSEPKGGYRIRNALKVPRATTYTAQALYDQIHNSDINLEPEYQRDVVWPETKQIGIIDSIFRNFYIPPVIFAVNSYEDGSETKTCIDGKQRLTSIHRFMDGLIPHKDPHTGEKMWYRDVGPGGGKGSRARKILPERYRRLFANKQIVCVEYQEISDGDEREIFQRVQLGMALTPAEKLQVISSPRAIFIREIQAEYLDEEEGLAGDALEWDRSRGSDFRCITQAVYCMEKYPGANSAGTMPQIEKWLNQEEDVSPSFRKKVNEGYHTFRTLVHDPKLNKVFKKPAKISPIEFILISLLIMVHKDKLSMTQLSSAIGQMRDEVRQAHVDIRMNNRVAKTMLDFIKALKPDKSSSGEKRKREDDDDVRVPGKKPAANTAPRSNPASSSSQVGYRTNPPAQPPQPNPPSERIAAVRAAKDVINHRPSQLPPAGSSGYVEGQTSAYPTMLPSPGQSFSFASQSQHDAMVSSLEASLMASMGRPNNPRSRLENPPPPDRPDPRGRTYVQDRQDALYHGQNGDRVHDRNYHGGRPPPAQGPNYGPGDSGWGNRAPR